MTKETNGRMICPLYLCRMAQETMQAEEQKAKAFVNRLLMNPALKDYELLQKEEQILQFLNLNSRSLFPTLSSPQFFPGKQWKDIIAILYATLLSMINVGLMPEVDRLLNSIDFVFVTLFRQTNYPLSKCREQIHSLLQKLMTKYEARIAFKGPFIAVKQGYVDRYVEQIFRRKEYIHFELTKVQRLKMGSDAISNFITTTLLLRNGIHLVTVSQAETNIGTVSDIIQRSFADKMTRMLAEQLNLLPPELVQSAVDSNLSFIENPDMETTSRIAAILAMRCANYKPYSRVDRGADYPDTSWFSVARRNYKFYGFDIKMLDEFYRIAAENGW